MGAEFGVSLREHGLICVVRPQGMLTERTGAELRRILTRVLLDRGRAVVDLDGFQVVRASGVTVFTAALDHCGGWPKARLVLCRPDHEMARALIQQRISILVPVYQLLSEAEEALEQRPVVVRVRTRLVCDTRAPDVARRLVRDTCPRWQVGAEQQQIAELVVSELVDNAVRHARSAAALTLQRGPGGLRIAVRDTASAVRDTGSAVRDTGSAVRNTGPAAVRDTGSGNGLVPVPPGSTETRRVGRGLELVARLTSAWGVEMHPVGKTVWAEISQPVRGW